MKVHELAPKQKRKARKRVGQGNAANGGTYAGRGGGGQNSRSGGGVRLGFEGGQSGILARMPKLRGFKNPCRIEVRALSLSFLDTNFKDGDKVSFDSLHKKGLLANGDVSLKILASGSLKKKLTVEGIAVSAGAKKAIEKAGGTVSE